MLLWWIANIIALVVVIPLVVVLAQRVIRLVREIARYAEDIREHGVALAGTLEPVPALATTRERVADVTRHAGGYVAALAQAQDRP